MQTLSTKASLLLLVLILLSLPGCGRTNNKAGRGKSDSSDLQAKARVLDSIEENPPAKYHQVVAGESVYRIARIYGVEANSIISMNYLGDGSRIIPGQRLLIPGEEKSSEAYVLETAASSRRR